MCAHMGLRVLFGCYLLLTISGETRAREKVPGSPLDGAAGLGIHNGLAACGEDINPSLCDSYDISEECEKNPEVRKSCNFSCSPSGQLWGAAWKGSLKIVKKALIAGANPLCQKNISRDSKTFTNRTAIHLAALANHQWVIKAILDVGVDVNLQTSEGITPTYDASLNGSIDALNILIEHNANVNLPDRPWIGSTAGWTPLMRAAMGGHLSVAKALINANASIDVTGGYLNGTALFWAVSNGQHDIVLLLIEHNANINLAGKKGVTPLMRAAIGGHLSVAKALINANASIDVTGGYWNSTALYWAVGNGQHDIVLLLIEHNTNVNLAGRHGITPLMRAAEQGRISVAKALINANASLDVTGDYDNATALYQAAEEGYQDIVSLLIEHNANVDLADSYGTTPLMTAAKEGRLSVAKALINANASLDVTGGWPQEATALYWAVSNNRQDVALLLLQSGADPMIPDENGVTPTAVARRQGLNELAVLIESYTTTGAQGGITALETNGTD